MDISLPPLAPRVAADLRPSPDAATARTREPPPTLALGPVVAPASPSQGALVARGLLGSQAVAPCGAGGAPAADRPPGLAEPPARLLKPWGVPMLPFEERRGDAVGGDPVGPDRPPPMASSD